MLKKLRWKFIFLTTLISIIVMILIAFAINIINYNSIISYADEVLEILINDNFGTNSETPPPHRVPREFTFTTRFFIVQTNENNEIVYIDTKNISSISTEDAMTYTEEIYALGETGGTYKDFRYIKNEILTGYEYIFLDIEEDIIGFENYLLYSVLIVGIAIIFIFILACLLSKKAVSPIAESYEKQKRFITNVSHEFKTPLAIIKADCDVIEIDHGESEWTYSVKSQITRLNTLVEDLISLARFDEQKLSVPKTIFSLSDAVNNTLNDFTPAIKNAQLSFTSNISQSLNYCGDEVFIKKLLSILVENAIKYSKGTLKVTLGVSRNRKVFVIENSCENVEIGNHNNWFERFYRADESRNGIKSGFGIGLSIAKSICDKHRAKINIDSRTGKEIKVTVVF